jgi:hypothetical protein
MIRDTLGRFGAGERPETRKNISGEKFNKLIAIEFIERKGNHSFWTFKCDCGVIKIIERSKVTAGLTKSCGCWKKAHMITHGLTGTRFYAILGNIKARCNKPNNKHYKNYGGRGITVCERWKLFSNFMDDMYDSYIKHVEQFGEKQTMIERKDNDKGYSPANCTWATWAEQVLNKRPQTC